jgi:hypothetical protein
VDLIPVQLTPRAQECLDEMRRLGGPFEVMTPEVQEYCAVEADKLLSPSRNLINAVKKYYGWWTTRTASQRHKDTKRGWITWVVRDDSGVFDHKTTEQKRIDGRERVVMLDRIRERARRKWVNDERRRLGQEIKEGYDDWDPEVAGLKEENYL